MKQQPQLIVATPGRLLDLIDDDDCPLTLGRRAAQALNMCQTQQGKHVLYDKHNFTLHYMLLNVGSVLCQQLTCPVLS